MADTATLPAIAGHGASRLPSVEVDSYNVEVKDDEGFIGDRASKGAFREIIENWRKPLRKAGDPIARLENVTLAAHAAFRTLEASMTLLRRAIDIVKRIQS